MTGVLGISGAALAAAVLALVLREAGFRSPKLVSVAGIVVLAVASATRLGRLVKELLPPAFGDEVREGARLMLKMIGAGYVYGICSDICRELGESGIANALQVAGRVEILLLLLPTLIEILELGAGLLK